MKLMLAAVNAVVGSAQYNCIVTRLPTAPAFFTTTDKSTLTPATSGTPLYGAPFR
jgi:hypothetical protein